MNLFILVVYNLVAVGIAIGGLMAERRGRPKTGAALLIAALLLILNLLFGGALLLVPLVLGIYAVFLGLPALGVWLLVRRLRRGRRAPGS